VHVLITRAMRNVGDDLIHQRARELIAHVAPQLELVAAPGWQRLDANLTRAALGRVQSIIVPGGPGARREIAAVYPFLEEARGRQIPVRFLGVGSRFFPGSGPTRSQQLDAASVGHLRHVTRWSPIGVRDHVTSRMLQVAGLPTQVNGCPAWYSTSHLGTRPRLPTWIDRVALSSLRKPTLLLAEDSRGLGVLQTLGGAGLAAWSELAEQPLARSLLSRTRPELLLRSDSRIAAWLDATLAHALDTGLPQVETAARIIDHTFETKMAPFIRELAAEQSLSAA
jgi:hypothetical protein